MFPFLYIHLSMAFTTQYIFTVKYCIPCLSVLDQWCIQKLVKHQRELFGKIVRGYRALTIFVKRSMLDVRLGCE